MGSRLARKQPTTDDFRLNFRVERSIPTSEETFFKDARKSRLEARTGSQRSRLAPCRMAVTHRLPNLPECSNARRSKHGDKKGT